jgi:hypothetical protein
VDPALVQKINFSANCIWRGSRSVVILWGTLLVRDVEAGLFKVVWLSTFNASVRNCRRKRFYEKVIKVKADVAALRNLFSDVSINVRW